MKAAAYAGAGVNTSLGDQFSQFAGGVCRASYGNSRFVQVHDLSEGDFRGPRGMSFSGLPDGWLATGGSDGTGTKAILTSAFRSHRDSGFDLGAMLAGDVTRWGGLPLFMFNDLSVATLGEDSESEVFEAYKVLMEGLGRAAKACNVVVLSGETAEMPHCITSEISGEDTTDYTKYVWSGSMVGALDPKRLINGRGVQVGDLIISFKDRLRSNGASLIRKLLRQKFGDKWYKKEEAWDLIEDAAKPSVIFDAFFAEANGWLDPEFKPAVPIGLIGNISGGGIGDKFAMPLMKLGFSARLHALHEPPLCVREAVEHFKLGPKEAHETFCCGNGAMFTIRPHHYGALRGLLSKYPEIEEKVAGEVTMPSLFPTVNVTSAFDGSTFDFTPE